MIIEYNKNKSIHVEKYVLCENINNIDPKAKYFLCFGSYKTGIFGWYFCDPNTLKSTYKCSFEQKDLTWFSNYWKNPQEEMLYNQKILFIYDETIKEEEIILI